MLLYMDIARYFKPNDLETAFNARLFKFQSRMEERLDDAIWVLKSHAETPTLRGMPPMGYPAAAYPQGMTEALQVIELLIVIIIASG